MNDLINITCWLLFVVLIAFEFSPYISTKSVFKKISILSMAISVLAISEHIRLYQLSPSGALVTDSIAIFAFLFSALVFFATCTIRSFFRGMTNKHIRRATD